jgi:tRNA-Thr(GGU) m(6)t(6)A37 methyltransferase TsaA
MEKQSEIWVLWWFDRNDTPEKRSVLQVHPQGNPQRPLTGVFATHSPVRPNLIAMTRCKIVSVKDNVIEIESIDAFPDTPVLDIKSECCVTAEDSDSNRRNALVPNGLGVGGTQNLRCHAALGITPAF